MKCKANSIWNIFQFKYKWERWGEKLRRGEREYTEVCAFYRGGMAIHLYSSSFSSITQSSHTAIGKQNSTHFILKWQSMVAWRRNKIMKVNKTISAQMCSKQCMNVKSSWNYCRRQFASSRPPSSPRPSVRSSGRSLSLYLLNSCFRLSTRQLRRRYEARKRKKKQRRRKNEYNTEKRRYTEHNK